MVGTHIIRPAYFHDADTLLEIRREAILALIGVFSEVSKVERWANSAGPDRTETAIANHIVWVAESQSNLVGWVEVNAETIEALYVRPTAWKAGIGSSLLSHAEKFIQDSGFSSVLLNASPNAEVFYRHRGYMGSEPLADSSIPMEKQFEK
ncbi:GNAT family N-acetyltransferase [Pleurocapsa sp. PCC 7319]|uniref:GNAT family N-acetyltransferase n=1 Tax=Pleurocapsa sp. PCC 7319 TaxID=118161 RepID=UPI00037F2141|nr:GNAT family N-acetyltransferase [Pleurocapsa sp. PCC 7319]